MEDIHLRALAGALLFRQLSQLVLLLLPVLVAAIAVAAVLHHWRSSLIPSSAVSSLKMKVVEMKVVS